MKLIFILVGTLISTIDVFEAQKTTHKLTEANASITSDFLMLLVEQRHHCFIFR